MATENTPRANWIKPAIIGTLVGALALSGYFVFNNKPMAPEVTFISLSGQKISSQSLRGKVVMVNFWATSCKSCVQEMPQMVETYNKFKGQGLEFVAVAMQYDQPNLVVNFTDAHKLPFTVAIDSSGQIAKAFNDTSMTPTTFVIDKEGRIIKRYVGIPDFAQVHEVLQKATSG